jgi:hypothetical protein
MSDELCRNEIFEHLTLACLQDRGYLEKAPTDRDLAGLHNTLRFKRLMENISTGTGTEVYGIWYVSGQQMKACYFMLDGSMQGILPNDRPGTELDIPLFYTEFRERAKMSETTGTFNDRITGYEGFVFGGRMKGTYQWGQEGRYLVFYTVAVEGDPATLGISRGKPDYDYRVIQIMTDIVLNNTATLRLTDDFEYLRMTLPPYRYILLDDVAGLQQDLVTRTPDAKTLNLLAVNALIYGSTDILGRLLNAYPAIDRDLIFLHACLYAQQDIVTVFASGGYGFDMDKFVREQGTDMFNHAAASGNVAFFETMYAKYFDTVIGNLSERQARDFKQHLGGWASTTGNRALFDIIYDIEQGKYHGVF